MKDKKKEGKKRLGKSYVRTGGKVKGKGEKKSSKNGEKMSRIRKRKGKKD